MSKMLLNDFLPVKIVDVDEIQYDLNEVDIFKDEKGLRILFDQIYADETH
jgi:hypothetical protein